jgi:hypothetical protein
MRALVLACLLLSACTKPCTKVARAVCDVGSEGDACAFVLSIERGDANGQALCAEVLPAAERIGESPAEWIAARAVLARGGFQADARKGRIDEKLKSAGGAGGRVVEQAGQLYERIERERTEAAERVLGE